MRKILNFLPAHIERVLKIFPDWTMPGRSFAEQFAEQVKGKIICIEQGQWNDFRNPYSLTDYRIVETRIEMNPDDANAGQVVAICERI
jgi:hypothetical protein